MMASFLGYSQAQFCAQVTTSAINGFVLFSIFSAFQILFSGYLVAKSYLPEPIRWVLYTTYTRWTTGQLMMNEYDGLMGYQGNLFLMLYDYDNMEFHRSRNVLIAYFIGFQLLIFLSVIPRYSRLKTLNETEAKVVMDAETTPKLNESNKAGSDFHAGLIDTTERMSRSQTSRTHSNFIVFYSYRNCQEYSIITIIIQH
jgi:hypothetical protein